MKSIYNRAWHIVSTWQITILIFLLGFPCNFQHHKLKMVLSSSSTFWCPDTNNHHHCPLTPGKGVPAFSVIPPSAISAILRCSSIHRNPHAPSMNKYSFSSCSTLMCLLWAKIQEGGGNKSEAVQAGYFSSHLTHYLHAAKDCAIQILCKGPGQHLSKPVCGWNDKKCLKVGTISNGVLLLSSDPTIRMSPCWFPRE